MLNKLQIIKILEKYELPEDEYIILSGASMVLQGIKLETNDVDITVSNSLYDYLIKNYKCTLEKEINGKQVWFINNELNFSTNYYYDVKTISINNYKVQTLDDILKLKLKLNREKDKKDIKLLNNLLN